MAMRPHKLSHAACRLAAAAALTTLLALAAATPSRAATSTVGSPLSAPATLNTADDLHYAGTDTPVPPAPDAPNGFVHTYHYGADGALWNTTLASGQAAMPADGQALKVSLEGCAVPAASGPRPLTQIHFQSLSPLPDGGAHVNLSSAPFDIPICGVGGASGSTVSTYEPVNLCVKAGDFVAFNEEGGWVPHVYQSGVGYQVLGATAGSSFSSFIKGNETNNGATLSGLYTSPMDGFAVNAGKELMLQVVLGTGPDARYVCPGGTKDAAPALAPLHIRPQTDGVNAQGVISVAAYCRPAGGCAGTATLTAVGGRGARRASVVGSASFRIAGNTTGHFPMRLSTQMIRMIHARHGVTATLTAVMGGMTFTQAISVKIF